jgi:replicative DNA helicase
MTPELSIIRLVLSHIEWQEAVNSGLSIEDFPKELQTLFSVINTFHSSSENSLSVADLANLVFANISKDHPYYQGVLEQLEKLDVSQESTKVLVNKILLNKRLKDLSLSAYEVTEGRLSFDKFREKLSVFEDNRTDDQLPAFEWVSDDLTELANSALKTKGLRWRLKTLNQMLGSLRKGDFGFVFARPETGKTTFLASEVTYMCEQLSEEDGPILWINNEEQSDKVKIRCYQASLGLDLSTLLSNLPKHTEQFLEKTKGKLKINKDAATIHKREVERLCKELKPSLIIFDQIDKIVGFENDREDLKLGAIYQWARELAKLYAPVIAVCQADGSGEGVKWLTMSNVANAKTAKQAEADWILGIGKVNDAGYDSLRFLHLSKNKLIGDEDSIPDLRHGRMETLIEPNIARYRDLR